MKNILLCNLSYYPEIGGVENSLRHLRKEYLNLGFNVYLIVGTKKKRSTLKNNDNIYYFERNKFSGITGIILNNFIMIFQLLILMKKIRKKNIDICISRNQFVGVVSCFFFKRKTIYVAPGFAHHQQNTKNLHSSIIVRIKRKINTILDILVLKLSKKVFVFSENMRKQANEIYRNHNKVNIINPGVDHTRFHPVLDEKKIESIKKIINYNYNDKIILCVGRLVKAKGFDFAIDAMKFLPKNYKCIIVGDGIERNNLEEKIKLLKLNNQVFLIGSHNNPENIYPLADIFAMTSTYEPFGQTILEAMSCNLPIVAFKSSRDIITATEKICIDHAYYSSLNTEELAAYFYKVSKSDGNKNRDFIKENYSWKKLAIGLIDE
ncbi:glycosyltransferase [Proteus mirabilis]|uniref:glycosyltransferase n=3 Tax=Proteus mirabilis TaxID=584 RepID=UPI0025A78790|nr:glycosyltransferase [Proteus mirabilis]HEI8459745.1 glycosyltransferase [Proteus mirabilis]HEK1169571.1 glycosyltransferase [Proteus mirabilis]